METKLGKIKKFIDSMEVNEVNESEQALLLNGDDFGKLNGSGCIFNCQNCGSGSNSILCQNGSWC